MLAMRWVHDLAAFDRPPGGRAGAGCSVARRAPAWSSRRREKPPTAHIARCRGPGSAGQELEGLFRRSVPYGTVDEHGLYFVGFQRRSTPVRPGCWSACTDGTDDGIRDRLTEFSRPVSGAYYFAPSLDALNELAGPETD